MLKFGKPELLTHKRIKNLLYLFKEKNLERGYKAEDIVFEYLKMHYPIVVDFRFPKELTEWITVATKKLKDFMGLYWHKRLQGTKFDFMVKDSEGKLFFAEAKSPQLKWLHWGCGATKEQYDNYFRLSRLSPFYIYAWISEEKALYIHQVRDPENPKMEPKTNRRGEQAYEIPDNDINRIPHIETQKVLAKLGEP